jgi:cyclopropane fatty-acyl-phospholipid synthase-like methyltransferase
VVDIGSGDGAIDLGISIKANCRVVGVDIDATNEADLRLAANAAGVTEASSAAVDFRGSDENLSTLNGEMFDHAYSIDVFEHVYNPVLLLQSVYRVLKPGATFFVQIWPLWHSEWGAHLFDGFKPWSHLVESRDEVLSKFTHETHSVSFDSCSRISLDDLQRAFLVAGFKPLLVELITPTFQVPEYASHLSWTSMAIAGVKVLLRKPF